MPHTPGPWRIYRDKGMRPSKIESRDGRLCTFHTSDKNVEANARLISASPEMLEALEDLERTAGIPAMSDDPVRVRARAVLAKVKGLR